MNVRVTIAGKTGKADAVPSVAKKTIAPDHRVGAEPAVVVGATACSLATGGDAGQRQITPAREAPDELAVSAEPPGPARCRGAIRSGPTSLTPWLAWTHGADRQALIG